MKLIFGLIFLMAVRLFASPIEAGVTLSHYRYVEPGFISHDGLLIGAWLDYSYATAIYAGRAQAELNSGHLDYDGSICDLDTNKCTAYKAKTDDLIFKVAHRFAWDLNRSLSVFTGLGYRVLIDLGEGAGFYRRTGQYIYLPLGFGWSNQDEPTKIPLRFDFEYDFFLKGEMKSDLSNLSARYGDVHHDQNHGHAWRLMLGYVPAATVDEARPWRIYAFYESWSIAVSEAADLKVAGKSSGKLFTEPMNDSENFGFKIGWIY